MKNNNVLNNTNFQDFNFNSLGKNSFIDKTLTIWRRGDPDLSGPIKIGSNVNIFSLCRMVVTDTKESANSSITIGNNVYINHGCFLSGEGGLYIGEKVLIGPYVMLLSGGHEIDNMESIYDSALTSDSIYVSDGSWIGAGAKILAGVKLGKGCVVASGAVVTKNVPDYAVVSGVPAKIRRFRKHSGYSFIKQMLYKYGVIKYG